MLFGLRLRFTTRVKIVLISPYEIGRQPFGLAEPAALLAQAGHAVECLDLSVQKLAREPLAEAELVGIYVAMHTATRIAIEALPRVRAWAPSAHICVYGLYAPMNRAPLAECGVDSILGGEFEPALVALAARVAAGETGENGRRAAAPVEPVVAFPKVAFTTPARAALPALSQYAHLVLPDGATRTAGFAEASRGCKHLCRHCPVTPVYEGKFRVVARDVVADDIRQQLAAGAEHISFGDPDFFNGPTHALKVARALHAEFPRVTFDATIKIEHILRHRAHLPELKEMGCLFITSAVESVDDAVLRHLDKGHTRRDFIDAVGVLREVGIALAPTFVAFTPWSTLRGYLDLLRQIAALSLVESIPPVQLSIRLLLPAGSYLFNLPGFRARVGDFDPALLGHPWQHPDPRVDQLQQRVQQCAAQAEQDDQPRADTFAEIWQLAHHAADEPATPLTEQHFGAPIPRLSEPWYCCAEPTEQQLAGF